MMEFGTLLSRRSILRGGAAGIGAVLSSRAGAVQSPRRDVLAGEKLYADVVRYSEMGSHRTASPGDAACTAWLSSRLRSAGYSVDTPGVPFPLFTPARCIVQLDDQQIGAFPAWPVVPTAGTGLAARLASPDAIELGGKIAVLDPPFREGSSLVVPGFGDAIMRAAERGATAVALITNGPTGDIIALNAAPKRYRWTIPVVLVAGRDGSRILEAASKGAPGRIILTGSNNPRAVATNVVARRRGRGLSVVISTPKSGWFTCAGERGSGIALFLATAEALARDTDADLMVIATTGHEVDGLGGRELIQTHAPPPGQVRLWAHIGANVASNAVSMQGGVTRLRSIHPRRGVLVNAPLMAAAAHAFAGQPGYEAPVDVMSPRAIGEVILYRNAGYSPVIGLVGGHPLHHTPLDLPHLVTSPGALEPVARGFHRLMLATMRA